MSSVTRSEAAPRAPGEEGERADMAANVRSELAEVSSLMSQLRQDLHAAARSQIAGEIIFKL